MRNEEDRILWEISDIHHFLTDAGIMALSQCDLSQNFLTKTADSQRQRCVLIKPGKAEASLSVDIIAPQLWASCTAAGTLTKTVLC